MEIKPNETESQFVKRCAVSLFKEEKKDMDKCIQACTEYYYIRKNETQIVGNPKVGPKC